MKPQRYTVIEAVTVDELTKRVSAHIDDGWECQGGIAVQCDEYGSNQGYIQAMVWKIPLITK